MSLWKSSSIVLSGGRRKYQEDRYLLRDDFLAVADGMGGHAHGDLAAQEAVSTLELRLQDRQQEALGHHVLEVFPSLQDMVNWFCEANVGIVSQSMVRGYPDGRGTTLSACWFPDDHTARVAHVGDSVVLRVSKVSPRERKEALGHGALVLDGGLVVQKLVPTQGVGHMLFDCLGDRDQQKFRRAVFAAQYEVRPGDIWIVASDGLYCGKDCDTAEEETERLLHFVAREACANDWFQGLQEDTAPDLATRAQDLGSTDNCTILMVQF